MKSRSYRGYSYPSISEYKGGRTSNRFNAWNKAVKTMAKVEYLEAEGQPVPQWAVNIVQKYADQSTLPRSVYDRDIKSLNEATRAIRDTTNTIRTTGKIYNAFKTEEYTTGNLVLPYKKTTPTANANALNEAIERVAYEAKDNGYGLPFRGVIKNANDELQSLMDSKGTEYTLLDEDKDPIYFKKVTDPDTGAEIEVPIININVTKLDVRDTETKMNIQRFAENVAYAHPNVQAEFEKQYLDKSYLTHLDKASSELGIDRETLLRLEKLMNSSAAWEWAKANAMDSDQMVDNWQQMTKSLIDITNNDLINKLKQTVKNYDGAGFSVIADIVGEGGDFSDTNAIIEEIDRRIKDAM